MRKDLEAHVRGVLKVFGICMGVVGTKDLRQRFRAQLDAASETDPVMELMAEMFIPLHKTLCAAKAALDDELRAIARESSLTRRLMTVPRIGPITALAYIATLDAAARFRKSIDVGAFLGITPRRHQSGDMDWSGRVSKRGDRDMRSLLYAAASTLLNCTRKPSSSKAWATRLCARKGHKNAAVAVARKLAGFSAFDLARRNGVRSRGGGHFLRQTPERLPQATKAGSASSGTVAYQASKNRQRWNTTQPRE